MSFITKCFYTGTMTHCHMEPAERTFQGRTSTATSKCIKLDSVLTIEYCNALWVKEKITLKRIIKC